MSDEQIWEQATHAILGAVKELGFDLDKVVEKAQLIMLENRKYRSAGHEENSVKRTIELIKNATSEVKNI